MLENAVARICLESIRQELPRWAVKSGGEWTFGRARSRIRRGGRRRHLRPRHLFTINWGDSGPGFSWPKSYHVTALAGDNVCVVTASDDSPDTQGYCDFAIVWFASKAPVVESAGECIRSSWRKQAENGQERWACLLDTSAVR